MSDTMSTESTETKKVHTFYCYSCGKVIEIPCADLLNAPNGMEVLEKIKAVHKNISPECKNPDYEFDEIIAKKFSF